MRAFEEFRDMTPDFWAFVRYISESLGYSERGSNRVKSYSFEEVINVCYENEITVTEELVQDVVYYSQMRADILNNYASELFMDGEQASAEFRRWEQIHRVGNYLCKLPLNKQKGDMRQIAFFTSIINIIAEKTIREITGIIDQVGFDDDPRGLTYILNEECQVIGASSRRFDGAYPGIENPLLVWEKKEYYYATTFGSRVADGVYETQLDGFEFKELYERTGRKVYHVLFIDSYRTWWVQGKSYICRLIDAINSGVVDEVIVGAEVLTRWPELLREIVQ